MKKGRVDFPQNVKCLFWDVDIENLDKKKSSYYIISRILEKGNWENVQWLWKTYNREEIIEVIKDSDLISTQTLSFWSQMLDLN